MKGAAPSALACALLASALAAGCLGARDDCAGVDAEPVVIDVRIGRYTFVPGTEAPIEVPRCAQVRLRLTSTDVTHGFAIADLHVQAQVPPGETVEVTFTPRRAGDFAIYCTVFCGSGHPEHKGVLHVA